MKNFNDNGQSKTRPSRDEKMGQYMIKYEENPWRIQLNVVMQVNGDENQTMNSPTSKIASWVFLPLNPDDIKKIAKIPPKKK